MTNEKWWETWLDDRYVDLVTTDGFNPDDRIQDLVLEAERRGYEKAMEEVGERLQVNAIGELKASCPTCHEKHTIAGVKEEQFIIHSLFMPLFDGQLTPPQTSEV